MSGPLKCPEPCLKDRCYSPLACYGWGYCRERNFDRGLPADRTTIARATGDQETP
jgi:hypothetical protein